jgi:hypothetical protein
MSHPIRALLLSSVTGLRNRPPAWHWVIVAAVALAAGIATYGPRPRRATQWINGVRPTPCSSLPKQSKRESRSMRG